MPSQSVPVFTKVDGINNKVDPARILWDERTGLVSLAAAVNVEVDNSGRVRMRRGVTQLREDAAHSIFAYGDVCLYRSSDSMYRLNSDWTRKGIRSGLTPGLPASYVAVDGKIYHSNGVQNGVYWSSDDQDHYWIGLPYVGPPSKWEISLNPPVGEILSLLGGYMLIAVGDTVYFSVQFAHSWYRLSRDLIRLPGQITMLSAVEGGAWVSTDKMTYFLEGADPQQWKLADKADYPAIKGTAVYRDFSLGGQSGVTGKCVLWTSTEGICVGDASGGFRNLTYEKLVYPESSFGAGIVVGNRYIVSLKS